MLPGLQRTRHVDLIAECRPDVYVKGGDYDIETLEETRLVRSWGGRSVAIDFVAGYSTTALLAADPRGAMNKAAFIDRDGVINEDREYVHRIADFQLHSRRRRGTARACSRRAICWWSSPISRELRAVCLRRAITMDLE